MPITWGEIRLFSCGFRRTMNLPAVLIIQGLVVRRLIFEKMIGDGLRCATKGFGLSSALVASLVFFRRSIARDDVYNVLWAVVFGFATLNILSLAARRFEPNRRGLSFGEMMAVLVVVLSMFLLGWELLSVFHIFPIKLRG